MSTLKPYFYRNRITPVSISTLRPT